LLDDFRAVGRVKIHPMGGFAPLEWVDLAAYASLTSSQFEQWEALTLIDMSKAYLSGLNEGENPLGIMPSERKK
jgi:hypothetical protein